MLLDKAATRNFRIAIDFETQGPFFGSSGDVTQALHALLATHANHPAYLRVDGRPVIFFWRPQRFGVGVWQALRDEVDPGRQALWIAEGVDIGFQQVFDGHHLQRGLVGQSWRAVAQVGAAYPPGFKPGDAKFGWPR